MPIFEYYCPTCDHNFEKLVRGGEQPTCPTCHSQELKKLFSTFAVKGPEVKWSARDAGPGPCGTCGDPRGPGSCQLG